MKKIIAGILSLLLVFSIVPMSAITASADTVKANALVITPENLDKYLEVGTKAKKNASAWTMQTNDNVTVEADGTISYSMEKGSTIGNINFFILKKALNQDLIQKAGGKIVVEISNVGLAGPQTVQLFRLPFSNTGGNGYAKGINADSSNIYNITLPESDYSTINSELFADDIRGEGVVDNRANLFMVQMYNSGNNTYAAPEKFSIRVYVQIDESLLKEPTTDAVATQDGASIRLGEVNGIRFYTTVDETKLAELVGENTYEIGTLIAPADALGEDGELTKTDDCLNVIYQARDVDGNIDYYNADNKEFVGSIVNIRETGDETDTNGNIDRDFMARAYVKVGDTYYYSATTSTRSLQTVASACQTDNYGGATLDEAVKKAVDNWAAGKPRDYVAE